MGETGNLQERGKTVVGTVLVNGRSANMSTENKTPVIEEGGRRLKESETETGCVPTEGL